MYIATILVSFLLTVAAIPAFIRFYHRAHISGQQMHEDVKQHKAKAGTPTMGGVGISHYSRSSSVLSLPY